MLMDFLKHLLPPAQNKLLKWKRYTPGHGVQGQNVLQHRQLQLVVLSPPGILFQSESLDIYQEG